MKEGKTYKKLHLPIYVFLELDKEKQHYLVKKKKKEKKGKKRAGPYS